MVLWLWIALRATAQYKVGCKFSNPRSKRQFFIENLPTDPTPLCTDTQHQPPFRFSIHHSKEGQERPCQVNCYGRPAYTAGKWPAQHCSQGKPTPLFYSSSLQMPSGSRSQEYVQQAQQAEREDNSSQTVKFAGHQRDCHKRWSVVPVKNQHKMHSDGFR